MMRKDIVWQGPELAKTFVEGIRGGIPFANEQIDIMLRLIAANSAPVKQFADLGCGNGVLAKAILSRYPEASGILIDFSEPMMAQARTNLASYANLRFVMADLAASDWTAVMAHQPLLDVAVSAFAIHHLTHERKRELYGEVFNLLKPGGMFINIEHVASSTPWVESRFDDLMIDSLTAFHTRQGDEQSREQVADDYRHRPDKTANILAPVETQCTWLRDIGFGDVDCYLKSFELAVFGGRRSKE